MSSRRSARPLRRVLVAVALVGLVAVVALVLLALPFRGAPASAEAAKDDLTQAASALQSGEVDAASALTESARGHVDDLQDDVQGVGGDVWSWVPVVGGPVRDVRRLANALDELTAVAEVGVATWPEVTGEEAGLVDDGNVDLDRLAELTERVGELHDHLEAAQSELQEVEDSRIGVGTRLADARDEALAEVDPVVRTLDRIDPLLEELPLLLGSNEERQYLVALLNPAEMLYSGGTPQTFTTLSFEDGRMSMSDPMDLASTPAVFDFRWWRKVEGNPFHRFNQELRIATATAAPDWRIAGNELANAWRSWRGRPMAGVIAVDVVALADLIELTGPVEVATLGTLDGDNLVEALVGSYDRFRDATQRKQINRSLVPVFQERLLGAGSWVDKAEILGQAADERHFAVFLRDEEAQAVIEDLGVAGALSETEHDYVGVFTQNAVGSKSDYWQDRAVSTRVRLRADGSARTTMRITIHNDSPPYVQPEPDPREGYWTRWNTLSIAAFLPEGATIRSAAVDGEPYAFNQGDFYGRPFTRRTVKFAPQARHTVEMTYDTPAAAEVDADGGMTYHLDLDPQGMVRPQQMDVRVVWPRGYAAEGGGEWTHRGRLSRWRAPLITSESFEVTASP